MLDEAANTAAPLATRVYAGENRNLRLTERLQDMEQIAAIPNRQTRTYGELAQALGGRHLARAVGQALGRNPFAPIVPCHRVLAAHGRMGGFSAHGGAATKLRMLLNEGWQPRAGAGAGAGADSVKGTAPLFEEEEILAKALPALPG